MASRSTLMKSILGREGEAAAIVFIPVYKDMGKNGYERVSVPKTSLHGSCRPLCGKMGLIEVCLSGALKGAERVSCAGGNCTESQDESHHWVRISALRSLVINVKAREAWSAEVSPGELQMFIVNGNSAKAHETQVKWRNG